MVMVRSGFGRVVSGPNKSRRSGPRAAAVVLATALAGLTAAARQSDPAAAQDASATAMSAVYGDWTLRCQTTSPAVAAAAPAAGTATDANGPAASAAAAPAAAKPGKLCGISSTITVKRDNGQQGVAMVLSVGRDPEGKSWRVAAELPISAWLPNGVKLQDGANTVIAPMVFTACRPQLCGAAAVLDAAAMAKLKGVGEKLYALYRTQAGQNVRVAVPMNGFPAALDALTANLGQ